MSRVTMADGSEISLSDLKHAAELRMRDFDALPKPYRDICNELKVNAADVYRLASRGLSPETVRDKAIKAGALV